MRSVLARFVLCGALVGLAACHRRDTHAAAPPGPPTGELWLTPQQVTEAKLASEPLTEHVVDDTLVAVGRVTFDDHEVAHVYSPVSGRLVTVVAQLGQRVKKGDPLVVIDSPDVGEVSSTLGKAQAELIAAEHAYDRQKELATQHATSEKELEASEVAYRRAKAELDRARAKAQLLHAGMSATTVTQLYTLRAPLDGVVIARDINPGAEVQGQYGVGNAKELFTIAELDQVWVLADIFEMDIGRLTVGAKAKVTVVSYPNDPPFEGTVDYVADMLDSVTRTARVRCRLPNPKGLLKPEMYTNVAIDVVGRKELAIPRSALLRLGDSAVVFVELGATADARRRYERRPVIVDDVEGMQVLPVRHGLERGDMVVVAGAATLSGML